MNHNFVNMKYEGKTIKNLDVAAHELGHARDAMKFSKAKNMATVAERSLRSVGAGHLAGAAMLQNEKTRDKAWVAPIVGHAATLRSEAAANYHGYKMLKQHGTAAMKRKFLGMAGKNMIGYASKPAAGAAVMYAAGKLLNKMDKDDK
jgi:hypothetical protein